MRSARRHPAFWLILAALLAVRAMLPTGWMPVADAGGVRIELCTGQGVVVATIDAEGRVHKGAPAGSDTPRETCPYGTLAKAAELPAVAAIAPLPVVPAVQPSFPPAARLVAARHAPRPPTRGPPVFA